MSSLLHQLEEKVQHHLDVIYQQIDLSESVGEICHDLLQIMGLTADARITVPVPHHNNWSEQIGRASCRERVYAPV